jgi:K+-dependent Na+/Ca+ exchanger-like protein
MPSFETAKESQQRMHSQRSRRLQDVPQSDLVVIDSEDVPQSESMLPTALAAYYWWLVIFYMFYLMSAICDEYLVPTVDVICEEFSIPEDVAGATLLAFACNGPELLCNVSAIFITDSSVGMGCIVGSAIFNVLIIVGACPIFAPGGKLKVPAYTFIRDAVFSAISIFILLWALPEITFLHASTLLFMGVLYVFVVYKSKAWFGSYNDSYESFECAARGPLLATSCDDVSTCPRDDEACTANQPCKVELPKHEPATPFRVKISDWCWCVFSSPSKFFMWATIPDVRKSQERHLYAVSFFTSMLALSMTSYVVVIAADYIHLYWGISQSFLGLTLVSIGTSWPNLIASVITATQGRGPIAVSNALGSNVQNVFLVLALPIWFHCLLKGPYSMKSQGINASVIWMALTLSIVVLLTLCNGFRLVKCSGFAFFFVYLVYLLQTLIPS